MNIFCFDAETDGLYGEAFAIGAVVMNENGEILEVFSEKCLFPGIQSQWVRENCLIHLDDIKDCGSRKQLREDFWAFYMKHRDHCTIMADVSYPVEAGLLRACVKDDPEKREFMGPYPLIDIASLFFANGIDPHTNRMEFIQEQRRPHNPLDDAITSAKCALKLLRGTGISD